MKRYPPVDSRFWQLCDEAGMTEEEIEQDWRAYCDGLDAFLSGGSSAELHFGPKPEPVTKKIAEFFGSER